MNKNRLEAFSDGVLAIVITIMVLEIKVPHGDKWSDLQILTPVFLSYVLSFIYIGIYWNNHHHMMHTATKISGKVLWANLHLLFWLSMIPFSTGWMGENNFGAAPMALYGVVLFMSAVAYKILQTTLLRCQGQNSILAKAVGNDKKGLISPLLYLMAIASTWVHPMIAGVIYVLVALMWLIPDLRIEKIIEADKTA
ncbi:putative membrane protein [Algoriphagus ratkowskyi]|uniref:DUF1211 domain-containing protein n=1 Tax=Algoriphagus ratkowskyi TaxID=57028 RepID=A0A2W7RGK8_9BACT|nr:TMEM175 family protein [Algoriphagus ratkowskyi]PZX53429.1 putative membrane protein [Algoriphagus ratkowskyi]TXD76528.1 DUF1211 domain-containing protein [Algoriphagus ratkowskyi]